MKRTVSLLATLCLMQGAHAQTITSAVPGFISYQGRALDANGVAIGTSGGALAPVNRTVTFRVWDHPSNVLEAHLIYSEQQTVTISGGEFSVLIGQGTATGGTTFGYSESSRGIPTVKIGDLGVFGGATRYLGVTIEDGTAAVDNEISPRQQLVSSAYSFRSKYAEQLGANGLAALTALDSGNVGIGNTNPPARFTVTAAGAGTSTPQLLVTADDVTERLRIGVDSTGTGTGFIQSFKEGTGAQNLLLNPNGGNVGIGTTTPNFPLSMANALGDKIALYGTSGAHFGFGIQNNLFQIHTDTNAADVVFGYGTSAAMTETMRIKGNGKVGIGTAQPANLFSVLAPITAMTATNTVTSANAIAAIGASDVALHFGNHDNNNGYAGWIQSMRTWDNYAFPIVLNPNGGGVGIGISNPTAKLDVNGNTNVRGQINLTGAIVMSNEQSIYGTNIAGVAETAFWPRSADGTYLNYGTNGLFLRNNASATTMFMGNNGNIGIGTTAPTTRFTLDDGVNTGVYASATISRPNTGHTGSHMAFIRAGVTAMGVGYAPGLNTFGFGIGVSGVAFNPGYLSIDQNNGQVKIGSPSTSSGLLNVQGFSSTATWTGSLGNGSSTVDGSGAQSVSINADAAIVAAVFLATSDRRIKTKLSPTDSVKDLKTLMGIEVTDYQLKDTVTNGSAWHKKVIAQQVEEVYPQAVSRQKGVLPDIYQKARVKEGWVQLATDLKVGERVRLILPSGDSVEDVLEVRSDSFRTNLKTPADELVVYGREVSDFRNVDYTAISMLNVSATQQLKHEKDAEMQVLRDENAALRRELAAKDRELAVKDESVEARLIALERRMSGEGEAQTVSLKTASAAK
jgi:hypothetical protein